MARTVDRRFPRAVYGVGEEPDPRFSLANERTFLAWIRTSLALLAAGVALHAVPLVMAPTPRLAATVVFVGAGLVTPVVAWFGWMRAERAMRTGVALPAPAVATIALVGVVAAGLLVAAGILLA